MLEKKRIVKFDDEEDALEECMNDEYDAIENTIYKAIRETVSYLEDIVDAYEGTAATREDIMQWLKDEGFIVSPSIDHEDTIEVETIVPFERMDARVFATHITIKRDEKGVITKIEVDGAGLDNIDPDIVYEVFERHRDIIEKWCRDLIS